MKLHPLTLVLVLTFDFRFMMHILFLEVGYLAKCCHYLHLSNSTGLRILFVFSLFYFVSFRTQQSIYDAQNIIVNWVEPVRQGREISFFPLVWAPFKTDIFKRQTQQSEVFFDV